MQPRDRCPQRVQPAGILDHVVSDRQTLLAGSLAAHDCFDLRACQIIPAHHTFDLQFFTAIDDQDPIDVFVALPLDEQRDTKDAVGRRDGCECVTYSVTDFRVQDTFELFALRVVVEHEEAKLLAIEHTIRAEHVRAKRFDDFPEAVTARHDDFARHEVRIDYRHAEALEPGRDRGFTRADTSGQPDYEACAHRPPEP